MSFEELGLSEALLKAVSKKGYTEPSPIQEKAIPEVLKRKDLLASAQTGTGKTAGFVLPIIQILNQGQRLRNRPIQALVLTPTRELAAQIQENVEAYAKFTDIRSVVIFGGVNQNPQVKRLRQGADILVATPGRLLDLHQQKLLRLDNVKILVLDEADRMLDMGFIHDIRRVLNIIPDRRQNLLFSATFSKEIKRLAGDILHDSVRVEATPENTTAEMVEHKIYHVDKAAKTKVLTKLIKDGDWSQVLIFTRMKHGANRLAQRLDKKGIKSAAIHGNKTQGARTRALAEFKSGDVRVLVATDIAARGLDIPQLPHVINFELPNIPEDYVHRIGRTGRAGQSGEAISLVSEEEMEHLRGIEKLLRQDLPSEVMEGFEPSFNPVSKRSEHQRSEQKGDQQKPKNKRRYNRRRNSSRRNNRT